MTTIILRAIRFALEQSREEGLDFESVNNGYIQGAKEQQEIDKEKVYRAYISICKHDGSCSNEFVCESCARFQIFERAMNNVMG